MSVLKSKSNTIVSIRALIAGLKKTFTGQTLAFDDGQVTTEDVVAELDSYVTELDDAEAARLAWKAKLTKVDARKAAAEERIVGIHRYLRALFGPSSVKLGDFGLTPAAPPHRSVADKALAVVKGAATRSARHTMGRRQRDAIHGGVTAPAPSTPVATPAQPSSTSPSVPATPPTDKAA